MDLMERQFGPTCEIVRHDLTGGYESTIVDTRNGYLTRRKIGDYRSNLGLEVMRGSVRNGDKFNYITHAYDGRILHSSFIYFHNANGEVSGALCANTNIIDSLKLESYLHNCNQYSLNDKEAETEIFANNVSDLLDHFTKERQRIVGKPVAEMAKKDKMKMLEYLDSKGIFLITKSSEKICEVLSVSKFTLYNYLDMLRNGILMRTQKRPAEILCAPFQARIGIFKETPI